MSNNARTNLSTRKSILTQVRALKRRTVLSLAGIFLIASGGYYEVRKLPLVEILYVEQGDEQFLDLMENSEKKGLILFYTDYCYPCERMNEMFRKNVVLASLVNQSFVPYRVDAFDKETGAALREKYQIERFPTLIITNEDGIEIDRIDTSYGDKKITERLASFSARTPVLSEAEIIKTSLGNQQVEFFVEQRVEYAEEQVSDSTSASLSLSLETYDSYDHARSSALLKTKLWKNEIWIEEAEKGRYRLMLGQFQEEQEVVLAQNYLKSWEGVESEIHELSASPQVYH